MTTDHDHDAELEPGTIRLGDGPPIRIASAHVVEADPGTIRVYGETDLGPVEGTLWLEPATFERVLELLAPVLEPEPAPELPTLEELLAEDRPLEDMLDDALGELGDLRARLVDLEELVAVLAAPWDLEAGELTLAPRPVPSPRHFRHRLSPELAELLAAVLEEPRP